jgi:hypothetical protein
MGRLGPIFLASMVIFLGCAAAEPDWASMADPGGPLPANYREIAVEYMRSRLDDPDSMRDISFGIPSVVHGRYHGMGDLDYWMVPMKFNAGNRSGGHTGRQERRLFFRDGEVIGFY